MRTTLVIILLFIFCQCGRGPGRQVSSQSLEEASPIQEFDDEDQLYSEQDSLDLSDYEFQSVELIMGLKTACDSDDEKEVFCHVLSQEAKDAIQILDQKILFNTKGEYLFRAKKKDSTEQIFMAPVFSKEETKTPVEGYLHLYKDTFYNMMYHARLTFNQDPQSSMVSWKITGGRYHIYDNEYDFFKRVRPFEKSILFLEKKKYEIKAIVTTGMHQNEKIVSQLDLSEVPQFRSVAASLQTDQMEPRVLETVNLSVAWEEQPIGTVSFSWEAKRIGEVSCPEILGVESKARELLCEKFFEIPLVEGEDYEMEGDQNTDHLVLRFKKNGQYMVNVRIQNDETHEVTKFSRHFKLSPVMLSHR